MSSTRTLAVLLAGGMAVSGLAAAPAANAASHTDAAPAATPMKATLMVTSGATTSRGGIVTVTGSGFNANESITVSLSGITATVTAKADVKGMLPATGFSIPYSTATGAHTIMATGQTSKRAASATVTVQQLTPSISLSATTETPGATATVTGKGFGPQEQVTLSLNGEAISTTAPITTSNGAFSANFTVPTSLLRGVNTVSAIGNESRVSAVTALTGNLPRATQFYMSGGMNTASDSTNIDILNSNPESASVHMIFYYANGAQVTKTVDVPAHSTKRLVASSLGLPQGTFGVQVRADRQVAAELAIAPYNHTDGDNLPGSPGLNTHWYLAAGSTKGGTETISVLNADANRPAHVQMQFVGTTGSAPHTQTVTVPAHTNSVVNINNIVPNQGVSVVAISDIPVLVERTQTFGKNGDGLTTRAGATTPATEWLFAAGTTANGVQTIYTVLNPGDTAATVSASFYANSGGALGSHTISVGPRSRATINLGDVVQGDGIAAVVTSNQNVVVERGEYTGSFASAKSGSVVFGRNGAGVRWTFPAGNTTPGNGTTQGYNEALVLFNPSAVTVPVTATYYDNTGKVVTAHYTIAPTAHTNVVVNALGLSPQHGVVLQSGNGQGFIAEQGITTIDARTFESSQGLAQ